MDDIIDEFKTLEKRFKDARKFLLEAKDDKEYIKKEIIHHQKALWVFTEVARATQEEIKDKIEKLVTLAIRSIFEREFTFQLRFETKANRVYATPVIIEGEHEYDNIKEDLGGSMVDIVALALKIVLWSMEEPKKRNIFIVDEPFRFTGRLVKKAGYMLKYLSQELDFQVIMISHDDELIDICDRVYGVKHNGQHSVVTLVKGGRKIKRRK